MRTHPTALSVRFCYVVACHGSLSLSSLPLRAAGDARSLGRCRQDGAAVILPKDRDPRFITIRRGGTLTDADHQLLALWAATCAEHVLHLFEAAQPADPRPRQAIEQIRAWARGEITMSQARAAGGHAMAAARALSGAARHAAYAAGQAAVVAHVAAHELGAAAYAIKAARAAAPDARVSAPAGASAVGSANSSPLRFANSSWRISGCATRSAGRCSTADGRDGVSARPNTRFEPTPDALERGSSATRWGRNSHASSTTITVMRCYNTTIWGACSSQLPLNQRGGWYEII